MTADTYETAGEMLAPRCQMLLDMLRDCIVATSVSSENVHFLSRSFTRDTSVTRQEAEVLFCIDAGIVRKCPEWTEFLVDVITDYVVWQSRPTGVLSDDLAEWLLVKADHSENISALAVLVNIVAEAEHVPGWFVAAVRGRIARGWPGVWEALAAHLSELHSRYVRRLEHDVLRWTCAEKVFFLSF